jgi:hypothetical protein
MELRDEQVLEAWGGPAGTLRIGIRLALLIASLVTIAMPFAGAYVLWGQGGDETGIPKWLFEGGLGVIAILGIALAVVPRFALSRWMRLAVLLPLVHLSLVAVAWPVWLVIAAKIDSVDRWYYLAHTIPLSAMIVGEVVVVAGAACAVTWRRRDVAWSHAFVMIALVDLLLLGLWLPVISWAVCRGSWAIEHDPSYAMAPAIALTAKVIIPPLVAAIGYAWVATSRRDELRPDWMQHYRSELFGALAMFLCVAIGLRIDAPPAARVVYANFIHVMIGALLVASTATGVVGVARWRRERELRRLSSDASALIGTIVSDRDPVVACYEIAGWLVPPRSVVRSFMLATRTGDVLVPGARMAAPLHPQSTKLAVGESVAALRAGDRVAVTSTAISHDGPFRGTTAMVGTDPVVALSPLPQLTFSDLALAMWRPAVAYLVILVAVALPALAALLEMRTR